MAVSSLCRLIGYDLYRSARRRTHVGKFRLFHDYYCAQTIQGWLGKDRIGSGT